MNEELKSKSLEDREDWFIAEISEDDLKLDPLLEVISWMAASSDRNKALEWCDLLRDSLAERRDFAGLWRVMAMEVSWRDQDGDFLEKCRILLRSAMPGKKGEAFVAGAGFGDSRSVKECLRRFGLLHQLKDGVLCREKTWGFGVVRRVDAFYAKVTVDFDQKPGHEMAFTYAAERLEILDDDHFLARRHRDPEGFRETIEKEPAEVVRLVVRSYGAVSVVALQDIMVESGLSEGQWKSFWDKARKSLKVDPMVDIPSKRSDPIVLRAEARDFRSEWVADMRSNRNPSSIAELVASLVKESPGLVEDTEIVTILRDRITFAISAVQGKEPDVLGLLAMAASLVQKKAEGIQVFDEVKVIENLISDKECATAISGMTGRQAGRFLSYLGNYDHELLESSLLSHINEFPSASLSEVMVYLLSSPVSEQLVVRVHELVAGRASGPSLVYWVCRNCDAAFDREMTQANELLTQAVDTLEQLYAGEDLKMQKQIRSLVGQAGWLGGMLKKLTADQRGVFLKRVSSSRGWEATERRSVLARIIKPYPELQDLLSTDREPEKEIRQELRQTSWRSYSERQEALRKLVQEEIPANSREIAVARSYGDLRENAEYKAAKEHQGILQRRRAEMESDLQQVRGTDFRGGSSASVGPGTRVTLEREGESVCYCILGEWDRDEQLGIISSRSGLAEAIAGAIVGETVSVPSPNGPVPGKVASVEPLPDEVWEWIGGRPS